MVGYCSNGKQGRLHTNCLTVAACRCVGILPNDVAPLAAETVITTHALRTLAGLAAVDAARRDMEGQPQLLADIVK